MSAEEGKRAITSCSSGLAMLAVALSLTTAGPAWGALMAASSHAEISLSGVTVTATGLTLLSPIFDPSTFPDVVDAGGSATSLSTADASLLSATADATATAGDAALIDFLYSASAAASQRVDFSVTGAGPASLTISLPSTSFLLSSSSPDARLTTAMANAYIELWNTTTGLFSSALLSNGIYSVSQNFVAGDAGYYVIGVTADATAIPEPATSLLFSAALLGLASARKWQPRRFRGPQQSSDSLRSKT